MAKPKGSGLRQRSQGNTSSGGGLKTKINNAKAPTSGNQTVVEGGNTRVTFTASTKMNTITLKKEGTLYSVSIARFESPSLTGRRETEWSSFFKNFSDAKKWAKGKL